VGIFCHVGSTAKDTRDNFPVACLDYVDEINVEVVRRAEILDPLVLHALGQQPFENAQPKKMILNHISWITR
jgi:hypothetical protein